MRRPTFTTGNQSMIKALREVLDYVDFRSVIADNGFEQTAGGVMPPSPEGEDQLPFSHPFELSVGAVAGITLVTVRSGIVYGSFDVTADQVPEIGGTPIDNVPAPTISLGASPTTGTHGIWLEFDVDCANLNISATPTIVHYTPGSTFAGDTNVDVTVDPCTDGSFGRLIGQVIVSASGSITLVQHMFTNPQVVICIDGTVTVGPSP